MNALRNKVQLIGNLGNDPEIIEMDSGKKLARFSMATNEAYRNAAGELIKETQWHYIVAWGRVAEISEKYLKKGSEVALSGKLTTRTYQDQEGVQKYITEVNCNELLLLGGK